MEMTYKSNVRYEDNREDIPRISFILLPHPLHPPLEADVLQQVGEPVEALLHLEHQLHLLDQPLQVHGVAQTLHHNTIRYYLSHTDITLVTIYYLSHNILS